MKQITCTIMGHETKTLEIGHEPLNMSHRGTCSHPLIFRFLVKSNHVHHLTHLFIIFKGVRECSIKYVCPLHYQMR
jgi:hypothetical protein